MASVVGAGVVAHGLHVTLLLLGLWGLAALLLPHVLEHHSRSHHRGPSGELPASSGPDEHVRRVAELRVAAASGTLATPSLAPKTRADDRHHPSTPDHGPTGALTLPLVVVAGTTAAGIHAAVAPLHLGEDPFLAAFFVVAASAQLAWVVALASRPRASVLYVGLGLNAALITLWLVTRVAGLPFGLLDEPHPIGGWDVACVAWQSTAVWASVQLLRDGTPQRLPDWFDWHPVARASVGASAVVLVLLVVTGAHA